MIFSIYGRRDTSDHFIFDRQLAEVDDPNEYDCVGVFEVSGEGQNVGIEPCLVRVEFPAERGWAIGLLDAWSLPAEQLFRGDFTDEESGNIADIQLRWEVGEE